MPGELELERAEFPPSSAVDNIGFDVPVRRARSRLRNTAAATRSRDDRFRQSYHDDLHTDIAAIHPGATVAAD